jgi:hypothetical protein
MPTALKTQHPPLQNMKVLHFFCFMGHFTLLDPDPYSQCITDLNQRRSMRIRIRIHNTACKVPRKFKIVGKYFILESNSCYLRT